MTRPNRLYLVSGDEVATYALGDKEAALVRRLLAGMGVTALATSDRSKLLTPVSLVSVAPTPRRGRKPGRKPGRRPHADLLVDDGSLEIPNPPPLDDGSIEIPNPPPLDDGSLEIPNPPPLPSAEEPPVLSPDTLGADRPAAG